MARSRNSAIVKWFMRNEPVPGTTGSIEQKKVARPYAHPFFWAGFILTGL